MNAIQLVGLGPGRPGQLTLEAREALDRAQRIFLCTAKHPLACQLAQDPRSTLLDYIFDEAESLDAAYQRIARTVVEQGRRSTVVYAVPGDPSIGDGICQLIRRDAAGASLSCRTVHGVSLIEPVCAAIGLDPLIDGLQIVEASTLILAVQGGSEMRAVDPFAGRYRPYEPTRPLMIPQIDGQKILTSVKQALLQCYLPESPVNLVSDAGLEQERVWSGELDTVDRNAPTDRQMVLHVPPVNPILPRGDFGTLSSVVALLRSPDGCPWDREQTHESIRHNLLEESYEAVDALDAADASSFVGELGDVLLQVVMHAQFAREAGEFTIEDVINEVSDKLIRRHPHVFGEVTLSTADGVLANWEKIKLQERGAEESIFAGLPKSLPALHMFQIVARRAGRHGIPVSEIAKRLNEADDDWSRRLIEICLHAGGDVDLEAALRRTTLELIEHIDARLATQRDHSNPQ